MRTKGLIVAFFCAIMLVCTACGENPAASEEMPIAEKTYTNRLGQEFRYTIPERDIVYEKSVDDLIQEWSDNVALAEKTYKQYNVLILLEGYIDSINKNSFNESYYVKLASKKSSSILGTDTVEIYFHNEREYKSLLNYKKGDYITLLCRVDSTDILEYPQLEAEWVFEAITPEIDNEAGAISFIGKSIGSITLVYGNNYSHDYYEGGYFVYYDEGCPYWFFYQVGSPLESDPLEESIIYGVRVFGENALVRDGINIGMDSKTVLSALGREMEIEKDLESEFDMYCGTEEINGISYYFYFTDDMELSFCDCINKTMSEPSTDTGITGGNGAEASTKPLKTDGMTEQEAAYRKRAFMLCMAQDDVESYAWGEDSLYPELWREVFIDNGGDGYLILQDVKNDCDIYLSLGTSSYEMMWVMAEKCWELYNTGKLEEAYDDYQRFIDRINAVSARLGIFYSSRELAES